MIAEKPCGDVILRRRRPAATQDLFRLQARDDAADRRERRRVGKDCEKQAVHLRSHL